MRSPSSFNPCINVLSRLPMPHSSSIPNNLISLQLNPTDLILLSQTQRHDYYNKLKKQANYFLLNAFRALQSKNFTLAKDILVYIADSVSCINPPDKQSQQLIQLCCEQLAQIKKVQDWNNQQRNTTKNFTHQASMHQGKKRVELFVMKYNKFSGEFQCDQSDRKHINTDVLFYLSKINSILFGQQTTQNIHSFLAMFKTYFLQLGITFILIFSLLLTELTDLKEILFQVSQDSLDLPTLILYCLLILPLLSIYFKKPISKNAMFFQKKLSEQIKKINNQCRTLNKKIVFMMPQGMELNVKVQYDNHTLQKDQIRQDIKNLNYIDDQQISNNQVKIDFQRIRRKVTHYYHENQKKVQINSQISSNYQAQ